MTVGGLRFAIRPIDAASALGEHAFGSPRSGCQPLPIYGAAISMRLALSRGIAISMNQRNSVVLISGGRNGGSGLLMISPIFSSVTPKPRKTSRTV